MDIEVRRDVGCAGNNIVELLADYQFYEVSAENLGLTGIDGRSHDEMLRFGSSFFRMLQIDVDNAELAVDTTTHRCRTSFGATEYDDRSRYNGTEGDTRLPIQLQSRQTSSATERVMVTTRPMRSLGRIPRHPVAASVAWSGLTEGQTYAWYVVSRDAQTGDELPTAEAEQMGVFTATAADTDNQAPELTIPDATTVVAGELFDPMDGVSAVDNTDGDLTAAVQVVGALDTATPGIYVLTFIVEDTNANHETANHAVTVLKRLMLVRRSRATKTAARAMARRMTPVPVTTTRSAELMTTLTIPLMPPMITNKPSAGSTGGGTSGSGETSGDATNAGEC